VLGLVLDLLIRGKTGGKASLDDVMRRMYDEFYVKGPSATYYLRGRGFTNEDFERVVSEVAGTDLRDFFARYVRGRETPPYDEVFATVGLRLVRNPQRDAFTAGIAVDQADVQNATIESVLTGSTAQRAGLRQGDVLVKIGKAFVTPVTWRSSLNIYKQGERVPVQVRRARRTINTTLTLEAPDLYDFRLEEVKNASPEARALRAAWLGGARPGS
jgi:predicted metalloprotease with PDZ domain